MKGMRWPFGRYLLWWCGVWLLTTVPTQLPECYERSKVYALPDHISVFNEVMQFAGTRLLIELPCGLMWGSLSWLLQWGVFALMGRFRVPGWFQRREYECLWSHMAPVVLLACMEAILLGVPLGFINTGLANFDVPPGDSLPVTMSDLSITVESAGIMLAFSIACLLAGYFAAGYRWAARAAHPTERTASD